VGGNIALCRVSAHHPLTKPDTRTINITGQPDGTVFRLFSGATPKPKLKRISTLSLRKKVGKYGAKQKYKKG
jgi:hypothetical protein